MTFLPRSQYELGDPVFAALEREEHSDHYRASARGQRLLLLADSLIAVLQASGTVTNVAAARADIFHTLADALCGCQAINTPDFASEQSLDAMRRGQDA